MSRRNRAKSCADFRKYCERKVARMKANNPTRTLWRTGISVDELLTLGEPRPAPPSESPSSNPETPVGGIQEDNE